jgi:hypothetical protein
MEATEPKGRGVSRLLEHGPFFAEPIDGTFQNAREEDGTHIHWSRLDYWVF